MAKASHGGIIPLAAVVMIEDRGACHDPWAHSTTTRR
jgi:hypothetical protein